MRASAGVFQATAIGLVALAWAASARAITQPDGASIPAQPGCSGGHTTGLSAVFSCVCKEPGICNQGAACPGGSSSCDPGTNGTCETTLWHEVNDDPCIPTHLSGLDPWQEAAVVPETFHPTCPQTFTLVSRGTAIFQNAFGWYNVTSEKPSLADLHVMLDCNAKPGQQVVLDLSQEPSYTGGEIGFFLVTPEKSDGQSGGTGQCDSLGCCATLDGAAQGKGFVYFSERKHNPDFVGTSSWIHLLVYPSHVFGDTFYFAWEDSNQSPNNDFTDLVTGVSGIRCSGAGAACQTGAKGVCDIGVTVCKQGALACEPVFPAQTELCNGLDDDCNGAVDDGATCPNNQVCNQGRCLPHCASGEFPCAYPTECDPASGLCITKSCMGVVCGDGQLCRDGSCGAPCEGVVCPHGQSCVGDACVDLCAGVVCPDGQVCSRGKCFPHCAKCDGLTCSAPLECDQKSGLCSDPACPSGGCAESCDNVKCPPGQSCVQGKCCSASECPGEKSDAGLAFGGSPGTADGGVAGTTSAAASEPTDSGCGCRASGGAANAAIALFGLGVGALGRRRRSRQ